MACGPARSRSFSLFPFGPVVLVVLFLFPAASFADVLRGRVVDPDDRPVARATVIVVRGNTVVASTTTDAAGRYGPITLPEGRYDVLVSAAGLSAPPTPIAIAASGAIEVNLKLVLTARTESLVVSAAQVGQTLSRTTDSVTVIDRVDLDARQTETASDVLRLVPGFGVVAGGGRGAILSFFPRGGESDYTLVMMNGIPLNAFGGGFDAAHLSTAGIDRVEIVRGPQSAVFGSGAIGGVVNVITRTGGSPEAGGLAEVAGQGTSRFQAHTSGGRGAWFWGASFERMTSDGDTRTFASIGGRVANDDYERIAGTVSGGWSDAATRRIRIDAFFDRSERGNPGPYGSDPFGLYGGLDTISRSIARPRGVAATATFGDERSIRHSVTAGWSRAHSFFTSPFGDSDDTVRRISARYQADLDRGWADYSAGAEIVHERADNTFVTGSAFQPIPVRRTIGGLFGEGRFEIGERGAVTAGVRLERIERGPMEDNPSLFAPRPTFGKDVIWSANPKIAAVWFLRGTRSSDASTGWTRLRAAAGTGIKPPTVFEVAFTDNPSLRPERSRSFDAGVEHAFAGALVIADATVFVNRYDDLIVAVGQAAEPVSPFRTDNIANAAAQGVELGVRWVTPHGFSVRGAYTFLHTEVLSMDDVPGEAPSPFSVGDRLLRRPTHQGSLDVRYARGRWLGFLLINGRSETTDFEPNFAIALLPSEGHVVASIGASYRLASGLEAYARVTNLFNRLYEDALGFPAQGRSAAAGVRIALRR